MDTVTAYRCFTGTSDPAPKNVPRVKKVYFASNAPMPKSTINTSVGTKMAYLKASRSQSMCMKTETISPAFKNMNRTIRNHLR